MPPSPTHRSAYSGSMAQKVFQSPWRHRSTTRKSTCRKNSRLISCMVASPLPLSLKRCDSEPLASTATRLSLCSIAWRSAAPKRRLSSSVPGAPGSHRHHPKRSSPFIAHRHQRAVFQFQAADFVRARTHARRVGAFGDAAAQFGIATVGVAHVLDEMRQLVAGVAALEAIVAIDVIAGVDQPVHVQHHHRVHIEFAATPADLPMPLDRRLSATLMLAGHFRQIHRRHMRHLYASASLPMVFVSWFWSCVVGYEGRPTRPSAGCDGCPWKRRRS